MCSAILTCMVACGPSDYEKRVLDIRMEKDAAFSDTSGPIPDPSHFQGLRYFDPSPEYHFLLSVQRFSSTDTVVMATSTGRTRRYVRYGRVAFYVEGKQELVIYESTDASHHLFLPFKDGTNGRETYPGGRYLDVGLLKTGDVAVDFNLAYNPYCAYSDRYDCPYPPAENHLQVRIEAGEKAYVKNP